MVLLLLMLIMMISCHQANKNIKKKLSRRSRFYEAKALVSAGNVGIATLFIHLKLGIWINSPSSKKYVL